MSFYFDVVSLDNPIRAYRLDETSGTNVHDSGSQAQDGTIHGGVTPGQASLLGNGDGSAMLFNPASSGYVSLPTTGLPTGASPWSIECWAKMPTLPTAGFSTFAGFGSFSSGSAVLYYHGPSNAFRFWLSGPGASFIAGGAGVAGATIHLVGTYDGSSAVLYLNGNSVASGSGITLNMSQSFANIGLDDTGDGDYLAGIVDEVYFYDKALSPDRIAAHYQAGLTFLVSESLISIEQAILQASEMLSDSCSLSETFTSLSVAKPLLPSNIILHVCNGSVVLRVREL